MDSMEKAHNDEVDSYTDAVMEIMADGRLTLAAKRAKIRTLVEWLT